MTAMLNIAHRGARSLAPENTIAAARKAFEAGADMWELDTGLLADGTLIIMHDDTLERTTNINQVFPDKTKALLHEFTYAQIQQLEAGSHFVQKDPFGQIAAGKVSAEELAAYASEPIPTLEEALGFTREQNWRVNVEIKSIRATRKDMTIVEKTVALIQSMGMEKNVLISSFNHAYLQKAKQLAPIIDTGWLTLLSMKHHRHSVENAKCQAYHPAMIGLNAKKIDHFHRKNIAVNVWTVNQASDMEKLIAWKADGIITDFPQTLQDLLQQD
jgi:glycerophosphoryl diester phosphodiesterase